MYFINSQMEGRHRAATGSATLPKSPQFTGWKAPNSFFSSHFSCRFSFLRGGGSIPVTCLWDHCWLHRVSDWPELLWILCGFSQACSLCCVVPVPGIYEFCKGFQLKFPPWVLYAFPLVLWSYCFWLIPVRPIEIFYIPSRV